MMVGNEPVNDVGLLLRGERFDEELEPQRRAGGIGAGGRLEHDGIITRYSAMVDQKVVGLPVSVFVSVKLERQKEKELEQFASAIAKWPEVVECYLMTGTRDYLMRVVAPDHMGYEQFLRQKLTRLDGVASIESSFALDQIKYSVALPL